MAFDRRDIEGGERVRVLTLLISSPTDLILFYHTDLQKLHFQILFNFEKLFQNNKKLMDLKNEAIATQRNVKVIILVGKYLTHVNFV